MVRIILFLCILTAAAFGFAWLADRPGEIVLTWQGYRIETSILVGLGILCIITIALMILWTLMRFIFRIPSLMSITARARRQKKGYAAVSKGMVAAAVGDQRTTERAAREAAKQLGNVPLAALLQAQAAQIAGDRDRAVRTFGAMLDDPETKVLGLRGLYLEAQRSGDSVAAQAYAKEAYAATPLPWAGQALLEHHAMADDWSGALSVVESSIARKAIDKATGNRQRGVLKTAIAKDIAERDPEEALRIAREAIKLAPDLIPAYVIAGQALARKGDIRRGARILEDGWRIMPHPDLARAYLDLRPGDSATDRLSRAKTLTRFHSNHVESRLALARSAMEARNFDLARTTIAPLIAADSARPSARVCLLMADLEETENGVGSGRVREWLARATRAPRDPMWIADGIATDTWAAASPVTGKLDAFVWEPPVERLQPPPVVETDNDILAPVISQKPPVKPAEPHNTKAAVLIKPAIAGAAVVTAAGVPADDKGLNEAMGPGDDDPAAIDAGGIEAEAAAGFAPESSPDAAAGKNRQAPDGGVAQAKTTKPKTTNAKIADPNTLNPRNKKGADEPVPPVERSDGKPDAGSPVSSARTNEPDSKPDKIKTVEPAGLDQNTLEPAIADAIPRPPDDPGPR